MRKILDIKKYLGLKLIHSKLSFSLILAMITSLGSAVSIAEPLDYTPANGWKIGDSGIRIGGYASVEMQDEKNKASQIGISNLSLITRWEGEGKLRLFSELDFEDTLNYRQGDGLNNEGAYVALERLYGDYLYSDKINIRLGKFLTPIGRWNVIHAAPLVWTTTRPLITEHIFPTNVTGVMGYGTIPILDHDFDYSVYSAVGDDWHTSPKVDPFEEAVGARFSTTSGANEFGISYSNFEQSRSKGERKNLLGVDYLWSRNHYEISMEAAYRFSEKGEQYDEKGMYFQGVVPLTGRLYAIGRYELYDIADTNRETSVYLAGLAMRLTPLMIIKGEYTTVSNSAYQVPQGLFVSFSILY